MTEEPDLSGTVLAGRYRVLMRVGSAGMGTICAARHLAVCLTVAITTVRPASCPPPMPSSAIFDAV